MLVYRYNQQLHSRYHVLLLFFDKFQSDVKVHNKNQTIHDSTSNSSTDRHTRTQHCSCHAIMQDFKNVLFDDHQCINSDSYVCKILCQKLYGKINLNFLKYYLFFIENKKDLIKEY
jgi:hypothetical protein